MKRREFLRAGATALAAQLAPPPLYGEQEPLPVNTVYVVATCHLDLGFTDFEQVVVQTYFEDYIPKAIATARSLLQTTESERYVWTLASWMIYEYLERASTENRKSMERAIADGFIAWHAMPFTWYTEMLDRSLIKSAFGISKALDRRFGITTIAGKLSDVPGHTMGLIGPAVEAGIQFLDIGVNPHPPDVPPAPHLFNWRDRNGIQITVLYHLLNYGGTVVIPGTDVAVAINVRGDNTGPHPIEEIKTYYRDLRRRFPDARIIATNLNTVAKAVEPIADRLPRVSQEIGDTWVYGIGSDPTKTIRYRELSRLRLEWLSQDAFRAGDAIDLAFSSKLILATEHNWGLDTGVAAQAADASRTIPRSDVLLDHPDIYTPDELAKARATNPAFYRLEACWAEKRADLDKAVEALPAQLQNEARQRLQSLTPVAPTTHRFKLHPHGTEIKTKHFTLALDPKTGAIQRLLDHHTGREWATTTHPLALFRYQMFSSAECQRYVRQYSPYPEIPWANDVWGKPGLEKYAVEGRTWEPSVATVYCEESAREFRIVVEMELQDADPKIRQFISWPRRLVEEIRLPKATPEIRCTLWCFEKRANRMPEAMWFSFSPDAPSPSGWQFEKVNYPVSPLNVISNGARHLHAVTRRVSYRDDRGILVLETLDAPLIAPGQRLLTDFNNQQPEMLEGVHVNLFNNLWNVSFPQWFDDDTCFRFVMSFPGAETGDGFS